MVFMQFNLTQFAADILRKEPQQESFIKMLTTPEEIPTADEIEVFKILQKCLELRDSYLFREEVTPWEKEAINDPCTPKPNPNPFTYVREPKSEHVFQMVDGVVHVYADKDCTESIYPVADATTFFTDLHYILRVTVIGTRLLPWIDRKLYEWEMEGRGLNDDERWRGAVVPRARGRNTRGGRRVAAARVSGTPGSLKEAEQLGNFLPRRLHRIVIFTMSGRLTLMFIIQHA
ncbi:probable AMP deaminase isoform X1 [Miscanthus floridulus]|uniref:probable AMP deaminase isoform X1 n=1 Tax=Miscanthus floridulus TaxID=154761 RepID=UPI0034586297